MLLGPFAVSWESRDVEEAEVCERFFEAILNWCSGENPSEFGL